MKKVIFNIIYYNLINLNGDWGLGIGDWGLGDGPNPPSPNPQRPLPISKTQLKKINKFN